MKHLARHVTAILAREKEITRSNFLRLASSSEPVTVPLPKEAGSVSETNLESAPVEEEFYDKYDPYSLACTD